MYAEDYWIITVLTIIFWLCAAGVFGCACEKCDEKTRPAKKSIILTLLFIFWPVGLVVIPLYIVGYLFFLLFSKTEETIKPLETKTQAYTNCPYCGHNLISSTETLKCENCGYTTNGLPVRE